MDIWVTAKIVYYGKARWTKVLTVHKTKEEAEKEALKIEKETGEKIYTGTLNVIKGVDPKSNGNLNI